MAWLAGVGAKTAHLSVGDVEGGHGSNGVDHMVEALTGWRRRVTVAGTQLAQEVAIWTVHQVTWSK